jgi:1-acyl-sn-glycerol-3-phosphate acyltransferase
MTALRKYIKAFLFFLIVVFFLGATYLVNLIIGSKKRRLRYCSRITSFYSKLILIVCGVRVETRNLDKLKERKENYLIVSNHLSYLDTFVIDTVVPAIFIANSEMEDEFPLGLVTKNSGGVFVERRNRGSILKDIDNIKDILNMGLDMVLFPEGTTSDGEGVMKFRTPFFTSAIESNVDILPICLSYKTIDGKDVTASNKNLVFFYGDIDFFEHFFRMLELKSIVVELTELESIEVGPESSRKEAGRTAHRRISDAYHGGPARV